MHRLVDVALSSYVHGSSLCDKLGRIDSLAGNIWMVDIPEKYKIGHEVNTRTINDSEVIDAPHVRVVLLKMVEAGEVAPSRVRHISQSLAEKKAVLSKLDDLGIRTFILAPKQGFRDSDGTASSEKTNYALTRIFERFVEATEAADPAERARIAELGMNFLSQYARPAESDPREET